MAVNLNRELSAKTPGLRHVEFNMYRGHGASGLEDLMKTGVVQGTEDYQGRAYWSRNAPLAHYVSPDRNGYGAVIELETNGNPRPYDRRMPTKNGYPATHGTPESAHINRFTDPIRVYTPDAQGNFAQVYDNATPWKRGLRTIGYNAIGNTGMRALAMGTEALANPVLGLAGPVMDMYDMAHNDPVARNYNAGNPAYSRTIGHK
jgi:hypothetical protein